MAKAIVITPTTGAPELAQAHRSVINQTIEVDHLIISDGQQFVEKTNNVLNGAGVDNGNRLFRCDLPFNTGGGGFYGHRVMAAFSHLINHDYILFLDQDNWLDPDHVASLVGEIERFNFDWSYSLRKIYDKDGNYLCDDNCESLGRWPAWVNNQAHLIDSSSYCFKNAFIRKIGHLWDHGWGADRRFYTLIKDELKHKNYSCSGKHSMNYRLGGNEGSVTGEFFQQGNQKMAEQYRNGFPWINQPK